MEAPMYFFIAVFAVTFVHGVIFSWMLERSGAVVTRRLWWAFVAWNVAAYFIGINWGIVWTLAASNRN